MHIIKTLKISVSACAECPTFYNKTLSVDLLIILAFVRNKTRESVSKANSCTSAEECATNMGLISKHTEQEVCLGFYL
jgi:hypothetical protein